MPRANRHYLPGHIWHITHRCHKQEFLLKFARDKKRWVYWLFEARKRFGLCVLNYVVTSNHIHLLVYDTEENTVPRSLQLVAGRTGQEFNVRKRRKGAFWEDRYHATAVQSGDHFIRCLAYIDLNMVRAGVVAHPSDWEFGGYNEIQNPKTRYTVTDRKKLMDLLAIESDETLKAFRRKLIDPILRSKDGKRDGRWTESVAVGNEEFVKSIHTRLGIRARGRSVFGDHVRENDIFHLKEPQSPYGDVFPIKKAVLKAKNSYIWNDNHL